MLACFLLGVKLKSLRDMRGADDISSAYNLGSGFNGTTQDVPSGDMFWGRLWSEIRNIQQKIVPPGGEE